MFKILGHFLVTELILSLRCMNWALTPSQQYVSHVEILPPNCCLLDLRWINELNFCLRLLAALPKRLHADHLSLWPEWIWVWAPCPHGCGPQFWKRLFNYQVMCNKNSDDNDDLVFYIPFNIIQVTVFDLINAHTPISAQSSNSVVFRLQPVYFLSTSL